MKPEQVIAKRLREVREELGLSQEALGVLAGIDEATAKVRISQYENSRHIPPLSMLFKLASVVNKPPAWFIVDEEMKDALSSLYLASAQQRASIIEELTQIIKDSPSNESSTKLEGA
jgi:transcriptional regulator with XRE-family HTH domain